MKAVVQQQYGDPKNLQIVDIPKPVPRSDEVLVKIKATTINDYDWAMVTGRPHIYRLMFGLTAPKNPFLGMEFAGIVESIGQDVSQFKVGDYVYGDSSDDKFGTFAEYFCINAEDIVKMPEETSFEQAATIPHAALLAIQSLSNVANLQNNQKILINGAGGGVGHFALQYAKLSNAHVTGVDTTHKLKQMKNSGFDEVLDYTQVNFTKLGHSYDIILDAKSTQNIWNYAKCLNENGTYVSVGGHLPKIIQLAIMGPIISRVSNKTFAVLALDPNKGLEELTNLIKEKKISCPIDGPYSLDQIATAVQRFGDARHYGKIVITI